MLEDAGPTVPCRAALPGGSRYPAPLHSSRAPLVVGSITALPGSRATGLVPLDIGEAARVDLPVALVRGALPGPPGDPVLALAG